MARGIPINKAEFEEKMGRVPPYHSSRHESDNKYHIYSACHSGQRIQTQCACEKEMPEERCAWCQDTSLVFAG